MEDYENLLSRYKYEERYDDESFWEIHKYLFGIKYIISDDIANLIYDYEQNILRRKYQKKYSLEIEEISCTFDKVFLENKLHFLSNEISQNYIELLKSIVGFIDLNEKFEKKITSFKSIINDLSNLSKNVKNLEDKTIFKCLKNLINKYSKLIEKSEIEYKVLENNYDYYHNEQHERRANNKD